MVEQRSPKPPVWVQLLLPLLYKFHIMAVVVKWLTHRIVVPTFVGSIPTGRPIFVYKDLIIYCWAIAKR